MPKIHYHALVHIVRDVDIPLPLEEAIKLDKQMLREEIGKIITGKIVVSDLFVQGETNA